MANLRFTYFDIKGGRGQVARLALEMGGVDFEDRRLSFQEFVETRATFPYCAVPILERDGQVLAQSNAINRYVGKLAGLYPEHPWQAALCDETMDAVEDIRNKIQPTLFLRDEEEKKAAREALADGPIRVYLERLGRKLEERGGEYFADGRLTIADLKVFVWVKGLRAGILDHVPADLPDTASPQLAAHCERMLAVPAIAKHYAE